MDNDKSYWSSRLDGRFYVAVDRECKDHGMLSIVDDGKLVYEHIIEIFPDDREGNIARWKHIAVDVVDGIYRRENE